MCKGLNKTNKEKIPMKTGLFFEQALFVLYLLLSPSMHSHALFWNKGI
ncbi:hypothetical protein [uncultured Gammaproteobacteria bacterium]|nr:hypothetical protein [uncultured Gammaproteobacteria bacterium]